MLSPIEFEKKYGCTSSGFRNWLGRTCTIGMKELRGADMLEEFIGYYKEHKQRNVRFDKQFGVEYNAFRNWLKHRYNLSMSELSYEGKCEYVDEYKECLVEPEFEITFGVDKDNFRKWLMYNHGVSIKDLSDEEVPEYVEMYKPCSLKNNKNRNTL